jgi:hypothetical protein
MTFSVPERRYDPGAAAFGPFAIPDGMTRIEIGLTRVNWPENGLDVVTLAVDVSVDSGQTWRYWYGFTAPGGAPIDDETGQIATRSYMSTGIPAGTNRRVRGRVTVTLPLDTAVSIEVA